MGYHEGPTLLRGSLFLGICVAAAIRLQGTGLGATATVIAGAHFVLGFAWTVTPTSLSQTPRAIAINLWFLTIYAGLGLLIYSFFD